MKVTSYALTVAASALLVPTVWAQNPSSSQTPQSRPESQPSYGPGGIRNPGVNPSSSQTPQSWPESQPPCDPGNVRTRNSQPQQGRPESQSPYVTGGARAPSSQTPQSWPESQPDYSPGGIRTPGISPCDTTEGQKPLDPVISARKFVKEAAERSATAIALGNVAQERGSSDAVKQFGKRMVDDHSKTTEELKQAAGKSEIAVPSETSNKARKAQDKLSKLSGAEFDRAYAKIMVSDNREDVKAFEREAREGTVPHVRDFAVKTLPTLQEHLKLAEELYASAGKASEVSSR